MTFQLLHTGALPRAWDTRQRQFRSRQRLYREWLSTKACRHIFYRQRGLCQELFIGLSAKGLPRAHPSSRQRKVAVTAVGRLTADLPRATWPSSRQRNLIFSLKTSLLRASRRALAKVINFFWISSLPRARPEALGKAGYFAMQMAPLPRALVLALSKSTIFFRFVERALGKGTIFLDLLRAPSANRPKTFFSIFSSNFH